MKDVLALMTEWLNREGKNWEEALIEGSYQ